ncbi:hypothetical protein HDV00_003902 [Rhizophlyctis rosea]|nr:hypothetical protein HDV00_003902 [Rhizophlyctis rosea]
MPGVPALPPSHIPNVQQVLTTSLNDVPAQLKRITTDSSQQTLIVIDALSSVTPIFNLSIFLRDVADLTSDTCRLVILYHGDIPSPSPPPILPDALLSHLCTTYITVRHLKTLTDDKVSIDANSLTGGVADVLHKKKSGKVVKESVVYEADGERVRVRFMETAAQQQAKGLSLGSSEEVAVKPPPSKDPTANLSFNLSLTDSQKAARSEVVLPYMSVQNPNPQEASVVKTHTEPTIYYDLEEDEYDSEDPDADLDI